MPSQEALAIKIPITDHGPWRVADIRPLIKHLDLTSPMLAAMSWLPTNETPNGLIRVDGFACGMRVFVVSGRVIMPYQYGALAERQFVNGLCPWCGTVVAPLLLERTIAPNPAAGAAVGYSRRWAGETVVAEYGLTAACPDCQGKEGRRPLVSMASQVHIAPWNGIENPRSKRMRQFRMLKPTFRWEFDFPMYATLDVKAGTFAVGSEWWGISQ